MKRILYIILLNIVTVGALAQSNIRLNNYWENLYSINPAAIDNQYRVLVSLGDRKQWIGFPGAPNTIYASATTYVEQFNTQLGVRLFRDNIGYTSTTHAALSYAYAVKLDDIWTLNMGLAGNLHSLSYDVDKINTGSIPDTKVYQILQNTNDYSAEVGAELVSTQWRFGASGQNLFSIFSKEKAKQYPYTTFLYGKYRTRNGTLLDTGAGISGIQTGNLYQVEVNATGFLKNYDQEDLMHFGIFYRTMREMGAIFGINLGSSLYLSYSCDFNISGIARSSAGTHELILVLKLNKIINCRCNQY
ncbi:MAG: PorP/SprF family type IX secretion system membrane protein [Bacteroidota bacterium]|nr:PorP/SprF family type IX secretion system membrane protein [Bacteroidota bacterium]